jgi:hypothetical protein
MKTMVSYVVQDAENHKHQSEILEITSPPYTFSPEPPISEVMKWAERKQKELSQGQKLVVLSMFKI